MKKIMIELAEDPALAEAQRIFDQGGGKVGSWEVLQYLVALCRKEGVEAEAFRVDDWEGHHEKVDYDWKSLQNVLLNDIECRPSSGEYDKKRGEIDRFMLCPRSESGSAKGQENDEFGLAIPPENA